MKLLRTIAVGAIAKKVYDEARKPHNQARIQDAVQSFRSRRGGPGTPPATGPASPPDPRTGP